MTDASAWERIEACLDELLALPEGERAAALERLAGDDETLRRELENLLAQTVGGDALLDRPAVSAFQPEAPEAGSVAPGTRIGAWRIVELIGRGGMGEVYRAERADGQFEQQAALKLIRRDAAEHPQRFQSERQILARLEHPGIARLLDGGMAHDGRPYMVMELVPGRSIAEWCRAHQSGLEQRLALFMAVCDAVAYAHRNLIIHRDLKPGNVMVSDEGAVKLLDFGIAKLLPGPSAAGAREEQTRHAPVTLGYAAPEQLDGGAVTTAADVYALGVLLFELLSGRRPWSLGELPMAAALEKLLREPMPAPSRYAAQIGASPIPPKLLRGDLDAIVAKAVRKEPERRYATVDALRQDVARHLAGEVVAAREGARLYALSRFVGRNRLMVSAAALLLLAVVGGSVGIAWQARRTEAEARKATAVKDFLIGIFNANGTENPDGAKARATTAEQLLDLGAKRIHGEMLDVPEVRAELLGTIGGLYADLDLSDQAISVLQEQVDTLRNIHGDAPNFEVASAGVQLGRVQAVSGRYEDAERTLMWALHVLDSLHETDSLSRAEALGWLAQVAFQTRPISDPSAESYATEALRIVESRSPTDDFRITELIELARINGRRGNYTAAEARFREALVLEQTPQFHSLPSNVAGIHLEYGEILWRARRYEDSESELRKAIGLFLQQVGPDYAPTLRAQEDLAILFFERGQMGEARSMLAQSLQSFERVRGPDDLEWTADTRIWYAKLLLARGELEAGADVIGQSVNSLSVHAPESVYFPIARRVQAELFVAQGRWAEAESAIADARTGLAKFYGEQHQRYAGALLTEAELRLAQQDIARAEPLYERVLRDWPTSGDPAPDSYVYATLGLTRLRLLQGKPIDAAALAQLVLDRVLASPQAGSLLMQEAAARLWLGEALCREGKAAEALVHLQRAVVLREGMDDPASPWLAQARIALAQCLIDKGETRKGSSLQAKALAALAHHAQLGPQFHLLLQQAQDHISDASQ